MNGAWTICADRWEDIPDVEAHEGIFQPTTITSEEDAAGPVKKQSESQAKSTVPRLPIGVYVLPKILDEQVALLHLDHVNAKLTKMTDVQAEYMGLPVEGPFKSEMYRY